MRVEALVPLLETVPLIPFVADEPTVNVDAEPLLITRKPPPKPAVALFETFPFTCNVPVALDRISGTSADTAPVELLLIAPVVTFAPPKTSMPPPLEVRAPTLSE